MADGRHLEKRFRR